MSWAQQGETAWVRRQEEPREPRTVKKEGELCAEYSVLSSDKIRKIG